MSGFRYLFLLVMILAMLLGQITSEIRYGRWMDKNAERIQKIERYLMEKGMEARK